MRFSMRAATAALLLVAAACSPGIHGKVQLIDANMQPIPATTESAEGTIVNMINTTATLEQASHAVTVDAKGEFESEKNKIVPGMYKVEASRIGYETNTQSVDVGKYSSKKVEFKLKKIREGRRKTIEGSRSDEDKIINPGEVNIQPPTM